MTPAGLALSMPFVLVAAAAVAVMLAVPLYRSHRLTCALTLAGLGLAFVTLFPLASLTGRPVTPLLILDNFAVFYMGLTLAASFVVAALSYGYLEQRDDKPEEYYILLLTAALGGMILAASSHFASFFLGLEILSVSLYALIAYPRLRKDGIEAGVKYLILAAGSAAFLLFGMALVYSELGTMEFPQIAVRRVALGGADGQILLVAFGLLVVGIGFKLALVPFHLWTPDVYQGAPAPVTAFVATVSKGAMFAALLRYFTLVDVHGYPPLLLGFTIIAIASMVCGNLLALLQTNVKRILAYSSIANLGYLLVAFLASGTLAPTAAAFYLASYFATVLGAFGVVTVLSGRDRDADAIEDYRGLFWDRPWLAGAFTAMMLSLAGIPLTAGFIAKFYILAAGEQSERWVPVIALVINSTIGLYYYLRIVVAMAAPVEVSPQGPAARAPLSQSGLAVVAVLTVAVVCMGVYPAPLVQWVNALVTTVAAAP